MHELPLGVAIPRSAKLLAIEDRYGPLKDEVRCGLCGTMHGKGFIARFECDGVQGRGLLGHVCGKNNFGAVYTDAERRFDIAQRGEGVAAGVERFHVRAAKIMPELQAALPHLSWQRSVRDAIEASSWQVMREAGNAVRTQNGRLQSGFRALGKLAGKEFWTDFRAPQRARELATDVEQFGDYLANDVRRKDLAHRVGLVADIEGRWERIVAAMADADQALRPGNLDKLFKAVNQIRVDHPEPWDARSPDIYKEEWRIQVRIRGTLLERIPKIEERRGSSAWIVETDLATGSHP